MMRKLNQKGEIILVILLVMAVGLTIGLAVASRSLTDVRLSTQIDESNRAFSAAEAGIEEILRQGLVNAPVGPPITGTIGGTNYSVSASSIGSGSSLFEIPTVIEDGGSAIIWLVEHSASGINETRYYYRDTIDICWKKGNSSTPAMEVSVFFKKTSTGEYKVMRGAYAPSGTSCSELSNFESTGSLTTCTGYSYGKQINFVSLASQVGGITLSQDILISLRLRPVCAKAKVAVVPAGGSGSGGNLPEQGKSIAATGQTTSGVTRKWNIVQTYPTFNIFDYAIWSNTDL